MYSIERISTYRYYIYGWVWGGKTMLGEEGREAGEGGKGAPEANVPTFLVRGG